MLADYPLTMREFAKRNEVSLAEIHRVVLQYLIGRTDAIVFGAQAVNFYVDEPRMTQDVNIMATSSESLAEEIRLQLSATLKIAARVRTVANGKGSRVYQLRTPTNRHLVDIRQVDSLLPSNIFEGIAIVKPEELVVLKLCSLVSRPNTPKGMTDRADILRLLLQYPEFQQTPSVIDQLLELRHSTDATKALWHEVRSVKIEPDLDQW